MPQQTLSRSRRFFAIVVAIALMINLAACGSGRGRDKEAQELADTVLPGQLRVLSTAVDWFPVGGGLIPSPHTSAVYAVVDDPDAVVRVNSLQAEKLRAAVTEARLVALQFRALEAAMDAEGVPLIGFAAGHAYLAIDVQPDSIAASRLRLDRGLDAWASSIEARPNGSLSGSVNLHLVRSDVVLPASKDVSAPRLLQWSAAGRMTALKAATEHQAFVHFDGDGAEPVANSLQPALSSDVREEARQAVQEAAEELVGTPTGPVDWNRTFYLTDELDQIRMYCFLVRNRGVIAVTVSLPDLRTSDVTTIDLGDKGPIPRSLEPKLIPR